MSGARVKLVVVGDGAVGKTCLLVVFAKGKFPEEYVPTVFENYTKIITSPAHGEVSLDLWDTAGQEDFDRLRPLSYPDSDLVCICFSLVDRRSFTNAKEKWHPEIKHYLADVPHFLVGTKADLRDSGAADQISGRVEPVTRDEGEGLRAELGSALFFEVSAKTRANVDELFNAAIDTVLQARASGKAPGAGGKGAADKKKKKCSIL